MESGLTVHITMAVFVVVLAVGVGVRAWAGTPSVPVLTRLGPVLIGLVVFQLLLGIGALIVTTMTRDVEPRPWIDVLVTTAHQSTGAVLLALSVLVSVWTFRFVVSSRVSAAR